MEKKGENYDQNSLSEQVRSRSQEQSVVEYPPKTSEEKTVPVEP